MSRRRLHRLSLSAAENSLQTGVQGEQRKIVLNATAKGPERPAPLVAGGSYAKDV